MNILGYKIERVPKEKKAHSYNKFLIMLTIILFFAFLASLAYNFQLNKKLKIADNEIIKYKNISDNERSTRRKIETEYNFFHSHAVIVTESGKKYHHFDCGHIDINNDYEIYDIVTAINMGYDYCNDCFENTELPLWYQVKNKM